MLQRMAFVLGVKFSSTQPKQHFMTVTNNAWNRINYLLKNKQDDQSSLMVVKISLTKRGCNGLTYAMKYIDKNGINKFDEIIQNDLGLKIVIDSKALMALLGTEMDFVQNDLGSQFIFRNPNEKGRCGCGESFRL